MGADAIELNDVGGVDPLRPGNGGGDNVFVLRGSEGGAPVEAPREGKGGGEEAVLGARLSAAGLADPEPIDEPVRLGGGGRDASAWGLLLGLTLGAGGGGGGAPLYGSQFVFFIGTLLV